MGSFVSNMFAGLTGEVPCPGIWTDFPKHIGRSSLPYIIGDIAGLTCNKGAVGPAVNLAANVGSLVAIYAGNQAGFLTGLNKLIPKVFSTDPATNATILEYLVTQAVLFLYETTNGGESWRDADTPWQMIWDCVADIKKCTGDLADYMSKVKDAKCLVGQSPFGGFCYDDCPAGFHPEGVQCYVDNPADMSEWKDGGVFIYSQRKARDSRPAIQKAPGNCTMETACGFNCENEGSYDALHLTNNYQCGMAEGELFTNIGRENYRRGIVDGVDTNGNPNACWAVKGARKGLGFWNCSLSHGCDRNNYRVSGLTCWEDPPAGWHLADATGFYKDCPPGYIDALGVTCTRKITGRTIRGGPSICPEGNQLRMGRCYPPVKHDGGSGGNKDYSWAWWLGGGIVAAAGVAVLSYSTGTKSAPSGGK